MKKAILILAVISALLVLMLAFASVVSADNGPHGNFGAKNSSSQTDSCAGCHRAHTGTAENLLRWGPTQYDFCKTCHGPVGQGAVTNVVDGELQGVGGGTVSNLYGNSTQDWSWGAANGDPLNGGGFESMMLFNYGSGSYTVKTWSSVTSKHLVDGTPGAPQTVTAWGGGFTGPGIAGTLECSSCHDPHGSPNYRILNQGYGHGAVASWTQEAGIWGAYYNKTTGQEPVVGSNEVNPGAHDYSAKLNVRYDYGISDFCGACHQQYLLTAAKNETTGASPDAINAPYDAGDGNVTTRYRHPISSKGYYASGTRQWVTTGGPYIADNEWINVYPLGANPAAKIYSGSANALRRVVTWTFGGSKTSTNYVVSQIGANATNYNGTGVTCLTCHYAHGSAAQATGWASNVAPTNDSALLFLDNRGVCQSCHQKGNGGSGY